MPAYTQADLNSYFASLQALGPNQIMFIGGVPMRYLANGSMAVDPIWGEMMAALDTRGGDVRTAPPVDWQAIINGAGGTTSLNGAQVAAGYPGIRPPTPPPAPPVPTPTTGPTPSAGPTPSIGPTPPAPSPGSMPPGYVGPPPSYPPGTPTGPPASGFYTINPRAANPASPLTNTGLAATIGTAPQGLPGAPWRLGGSWAGGGAQTNTTFPWNAPRGFANWDPNNPRANPQNAIPPSTPYTPAPSPAPAPAPGVTPILPDPTQGQQSARSTSAGGYSPVSAIRPASFTPRTYADTYSTGVQLPFNNQFQQAMLSTLSPQAIYPTHQWANAGSYGPLPVPIPKGGLLGTAGGGGMGGLLGLLSGAK